MTLREVLEKIVRQVDGDTLHPTTIAPSFLAEARAALAAEAAPASGLREALTTALAAKLDKPPNMNPIRWGFSEMEIRDALAASPSAADHDCLMPSACGVTGFYCSNSASPSAAPPPLGPTKVERAFAVGYRRGREDDQGRTDDDIDAMARVYAIAAAYSEEGEG